VKTNLKPKKGGGKGKLALDWWVPEDSPAQVIALTDLSDQKIWMFYLKELTEIAQQNSNGRLHTYMYTDPTVTPRKKNRVFAYEFEAFLLENRLHELF